MPFGTISVENAVVSDATRPAPASGTRPWDYWAGGALLLLHGALAWSGRSFGLNTGNDDAAYLLLARSIRLLGYSDLHLLGAPVHSQYPPGFPALLAILSLPFGERFDLFLGAIVLCSVAALGLLYDVVRQRHGSVVALTVLALCAVNPALLERAGSLASETPYLLFTTLVVWAVVREPRDTSEGEASSWWAVLAVTAAICAALTRAVGITILGALFLHWLIERRYRRATGLAVAATVTFGSWMLWTFHAPVKIVGRSYVADAAFAGSGAGQTVAGMLLERVTSNVPTYLKASVPSVLSNPSVAGTVVDNIVGLLLLLTLGAIGVWQLWKRARLVVVYVATYATLLAIWAWKMTRFLVPVVPFILWTIVAGAFAVAERRRWLRPLPFVVAAILLISGLARDVSWLGSRLKCDRSSARTSPACFDEVQRAFFAATAFIRLSTPDTAIFLTVKEAAFGYLTQRHAVVQETVDAQDPVVMLGALRAQSVDFVVLTPLRQPESQNVTALLQVCRDLEVEREFPPLTFVLRITAGGSPPPRQNACAALERYQRDNARWAPPQAG